MQACLCNAIHTSGLLDYAYLAANVYHSHKDDKLMGFRPNKYRSIRELRNDMSHRTGWYQLDFPQLQMSHDWSFYADLYAKVYYGKIQHLMISFRGTDKFLDYIEDALHWWNTVLPDGNLIEWSIPGYWDYALDFIMKCNRVIKDLDNHGLFAKICGQHVTGHSLGGALANLVAGKGAICMPPSTNVWLPVMPDIISFNAPGIEGMRHVDCSGFPQGQVISMRAQYDMVSALGKSYGYVMNNIIPEGCAEAKQAFEMQQGIEAPVTAGQQLCDKNDLCLDQERVRELMSAGAFYEQHSMDNFLRLILKDMDSPTFAFESIRHWAQNHGYWNHDRTAAPLYDYSHTAKAA
jgi:hypothetical protein